MEVGEKRGFVNSIRHDSFRLADDVYAKQGREHVIEYTSSISLSNGDDVIAFGFDNINSNSFSAYGIINATTGQQEIRVAERYEREARVLGLAVIVAVAAALVGTYSAITFSWVSGPMVAVLLGAAALSYRRRKKFSEEIERVEAVRLAMERAKRKVARKD